MHIWKAARENADDVAHRGAARRGDDADAAGEERQGLLARSVEQALSVEACFQLLEGKLQRAAPNGLEIVHVNLIFAAGFVDAYGAAHGHQQAVFGAELDAALLLLEIHAADLSAVVFQGEVDVAGLGLAAVGDFPLDARSEEHTSELQSQSNLVFRLLLEKKNKLRILFATSLQARRATWAFWLRAAEFETRYSRRAAGSIFP